MSFFLGDDRARWRRDVQTYRTVSLGEAWPGISLTLRTYGSSVEKIFTVGPAADPSLIWMRVDGAESVRLEQDGSLLIETGVGEVRCTPPVAFQQVRGIRRAVDVRYRLKGAHYGFAVEEYDPRLPLVIDPLLQATYLGGSDADGGGDIAVHPSSGDVYVSGGTVSVNFPGAAGGPQPASGIPSDAFVARLNASLTSLSQATYLGGSGNEGASAVAIHPTSGAVYVAGLTSSPNFPGTAGGAQAAHGGMDDAFVARLNASLTVLSQATYLGGSAQEVGGALAIHPNSGEVYVAGETFSGNLPGTAGGAQPARGTEFPVDAFIARLNAGLSTLSQATYLGGHGEEFGTLVTIHPASGDVYVAGGTTSADYPGAAGGAQPGSGGNSSADGFVARLNAALTALIQSTYLGGTGSDEARALIVHPHSGDVYVSGSTLSTNFPGTAGGAQATSAGLRDAFVARLNATLTTLFQASYLSGGGIEFANTVAVHPSSGEVYVAGGTASTNFPGTAGGAQPARGGFFDAFIARLNATLTTLWQATYLGGSVGEAGEALAFHPTSGDVYVAGGTDSTNFPGTAGGAQPSSGGSTDVFVARLTANLAALNLSCTPSATTLCVNGGRFRVTAAFATRAGQSGNGMAESETTDTGLFWFFSANNIEVIIKVVNGCAFNSRYWVFGAGLTDVAVTITVTDTANGTTRTYNNPQGVAFQPVQDTDAFATCP